MNKQKELQEKYETDDVRLVAEAIKMTADEGAVLIYCKKSKFKPFVSQSDHNEITGTVKTSMLKHVLKPNGFQNAARSSAFEAHVLVQVPRRCVKSSVLVAVDDTEKGGTWHAIVEDDSKTMPEIVSRPFSDKDIESISKQLVLIWNYDAPNSDRWRLMANMGCLHDFHDVDLPSQPEGDAYVLLCNERVVESAADLSSMLNHMRRIGLYE